MTLSRLKVKRMTKSTKQYLMNSLFHHDNEIDEYTFIFSDKVTNVKIYPFQLPNLCIQLV